MKLLMLWHITLCECGHPAITGTQTCRRCEEHAFMLASRDQYVLGMKVLPLHRKEWHEESTGHKQKRGAAKYA